MKRQFLLLALCAAVLVGCGEKDAATSPEFTPEQTAKIESQYVLPATDAPPVAPAEPASAPGTASQPTQAVPQPVVRPIQQRLNGAIHAQLTVQLRMFIEKNGRVPESFSEFVNVAMDTVPPAPDGMKFVIDTVDRAVKVVKK